jgi:hypothetical protein
MARALSRFWKAKKSRARIVVSWQYFVHISVTNFVTDEMTTSRSSRGLLMHQKASKEILA